MNGISIRIPAFWRDLDEFDRTLIVITSALAVGVLVGMVATFRHWGSM